MRSLASLLQFLSPQHLLSRLVGMLANCRYPFLKNGLIDIFIAYYGVDMDDPIEGDPHCYENFNQFFTRALKPERRPIVEAPNTMVCPVDGCISQIGSIQTHYLPQAKGLNYRLQNLLADCSELTTLFQSGEFATIYLAPKDYHRVHMPLTGQLKRMIHVPGQLFSVNHNTATKRANLFTRNERVITLFDTQAGPMAVVLVGALLVASVSTVWAGIITPSYPNHIRNWYYSDHEVVLERACQLGQFQFGSTVILLFRTGRIRWDCALHPGQTVRLGQALGDICRLR